MLLWFGKWTLIVLAVAAAMALVSKFSDVLDGGIPPEHAALKRESAYAQLRRLYESGELQRALADGCITDELAEAPELHIAPAGLAGAALILAIVLPIVGCLLVASLIGLAVYCCCCKGKKAAAGAPAQPTAVEITKTAV